MIELKDDAIVFAFPAVHDDAVLRVTLQRTLRLPDDNREYRLPQDLGRFPVRAADGADDEFALPLHRSEALWLDFSSSWRYPFAVKASCGDVDALTGLASRAGLHSAPQDYVPVPGQTWLDGFRVSPHRTHQFTVDSCARTRGTCGIRLTVHPLKHEVYARGREDDLRQTASPVCYADLPDIMSPGARLHHDVVEDVHDIADWDAERVEQCFIRFVPAGAWRGVEGAAPPGAPGPAWYRRAVIPWLDRYAESEDRAS